jgi:hypothetical protein
MSEAQNSDRPDFSSDPREHEPGDRAAMRFRSESPQAADHAVAQQYEAYPDKGPLTAGGRITIMTAKAQYGVGEEVRVIHLHEVLESGVPVYVMGPKPVLGEYLDNRLVTKPSSESDDPLSQGVYDGVTVPGPFVDANYDVTCYTFSSRGTHEVQWRWVSLRSNTLVLRVTDAAGDVRTTTVHSPAGGSDTRNPK